jgi:hypothetical protein
MYFRGVVDIVSVIADTLSLVNQPKGRRWRNHVEVLEIRGHALVLHPRAVTVRGLHSVTNGKVMFKTADPQPNKEDDDAQW